MRKVVEAVHNVAKPKEKQLDSLSYRGLIHFVQKVKKADEYPKKGGTAAVITKELTHVFQELQKPGLSPYDRGKSVLKVVFVSMYGSHSIVASRIALLCPHIDFMLQSSSFSLWAVALASLSLYPELHPRLVIELEKFLKSPAKHETWRVRCLLQMVTYLHEISLELAQALTQYIIVLLTDIARQRTPAPDDHLDNLTQKSCLTLCKLLRAHPSIVSLLVPNFKDIVTVCFSVQCPSIGVHQSAAVFLRQCILAMNQPRPLSQPRLSPSAYDHVIERCCVVLEEYLEVMPNHYGCEARGLLQTLREKRDYKFYAVFHPWLTIAILQLLQAFDPAHLLASPLATRLILALTPLLTTVNHKEIHSQTLFHAITMEAIFFVRHLHGLSVYEWLRLLPLCWLDSPLTPDLVSVVAEYIPTSTLPQSSNTFSKHSRGPLDFEVALHHLRTHIHAISLFDKAQSRLVSARLMRCFLHLPGTFSLVINPVANKLGLEDWELHHKPHRGKTRDQRHYCDDPAFRLARQPASMSPADLDELARIHQLHALAALVSDYCPSILEIRILEGKDLGPNGASCTITGKHNVNTEKQDGFKRQTKLSDSSPCVWGAEDGAVWYDKVDPPIHCENLLIEVMDGSRNALGTVKIDTKSIFDRTIQLHKDPKLRRESLERFVDLLGNNDPKDDSCLSDEWALWYPLTHPQPDHHGGLRVCTRAIAGTTLARVVQNKIASELAACNPKLVAIEQCSHQLRVMSQGSVFYQSLVGHASPQWTPLKRLPASQLWRVALSPNVNEWEAPELVLDEEAKEEEEVVTPTPEKKATYESVQEDIMWEEMKVAMDHLPNLSNEAFKMDRPGPTPPADFDRGFDVDFLALDGEDEGKEPSKVQQQLLQPAKSGEITVHVVYQGTQFDVDTVPSATAGSLLKQCREVLGVEVESLYLQLFLNDNPLSMTNALMIQGVVNNSTVNVVSESLCYAPARPPIGPWNLLLRDGGMLDGKKHTPVKVCLEYEDGVGRALSAVMPDVSISIIQSYLSAEVEEPRGQLTLLIEPTGGIKRVVALDPASHYVRCFDDFRRDKHAAVYRCMKISQGTKTCLKFATEISKDSTGTVIRSFISALQGWFSRLVQKPTETVDERETKGKKLKKREVFIDWIETIRETSCEGQPAEVDQELVISILAMNFAADQTFKIGTSFTANEKTPTAPPKIKFSNVVDRRRWVSDQAVHFALLNHRFDLLCARPVGSTAPFSVFLERGTRQHSDKSLFSFTLSAVPRLPARIAGVGKVELCAYVILPSSWNVGRLAKATPGVGVMEYQGDGSAVFCSESRCVVWTLSNKEIKKIEKPSLTLTVAFPGPRSLPEKMVVLLYSSIHYYSASGGHVRFFKEFPSRGELCKWVRYLTHYQGCLQFDMTQP